MIKRFQFVRSAVVGFALMPMMAHADLGVTEISIVDAPKGTVGLGFGFRGGTSPYAHVNNVASIDNDNDLDLVPLYLYEGDYLFAHGTVAGLHAYDENGLSADVIMRYRFDRLESDADKFFEGMEDREQTVDGGLVVSLRGDWGKLSASWVGDMMDKHNGEEMELSYRFPWRTGRWSISPFVSYVYQDSDLTDYYYGVRDDEVRADRSAYSAGSASYWKAGVNSSYRWSKNMQVFANIAFEGLDDSVSDSPLVDEDQLASALLGFSYMFGNALDDTTIRRSPERKGEWSWRWNAGYTAEETFHQVHRGAVEDNDDVNTYLAGFTLGKLLQDGRKLDYWGRFSLNRRLEKDHQSDFWEYNAYVMAMGTGYSPWTNKELFRYGFGFGFSYAEKVPIAEQIKQAKREENTAHFLNYLEAQVDFPFQLLFGERASKNCYLGLTLVHRSGIFANSDLLGNVAGGSDVLTGHVECKR